MLWHFGQWRFHQVGGEGMPQAMNAVAVLHARSLFRPIKNLLGRGHRQVAPGPSPFEVAPGPSPFEQPGLRPVGTPIAAQFLQQSW